jgi:hypothetical protein
MPHLIAYVAGRLAVRDHLRDEEVPQIVKPSAGHFRGVGDGLPDLCAKLVRIDETTASLGQYEVGILFAHLQVRQRFITLSGTLMLRAVIDSDW